jgi:hypothetical protein
MKGVFSSGPRVDVVQTLVSRLPELSKQCSANFTVVYELLPRKKILSVPNNATAHIRATLSNVLLVATWEDKDTNKLDVLRRATAELAGIVVEGENVITEQVKTGYGNYSER